MNAETTCVNDIMNVLYVIADVGLPLTDTSKTRTGTKLSIKLPLNLIAVIIELMHTLSLPTVVMLTQTTVRILKKSALLPLMKNVFIRLIIRTIPNKDTKCDRQLLNFSGSVVEKYSKKLSKDTL